MNLKKYATAIPVIAILSLTISCKQEVKDSNSEEITETTIEEEVPLRTEVLTAEEQQALTPEMVIQNLKDGNNRFLDDNLTLRDHISMIEKSREGQFPEAVILSCLDSRVPVEEIFDRGVGDLFVGRVAGNFVNIDMLGSLEYGCKVAGAKVILVLGHESCGAVKSAIDNVELGNITAMLTNIKPAVTSSQEFEGIKTSKNVDFVELVSKNNVLNTIERIKSESPILNEMEQNNEIKIIGAYYDLHTGKVEFI